MVDAVETHVVAYVCGLLDRLDVEDDDRRRAALRDEILELSDLYGGEVARAAREAGLPA